MAQRTSTPPRWTTLTAFASLGLFAAAVVTIGVVLTGDDLTATLMDGRYPPGGSWTVRGLTILSIVLASAALAMFAAVGRRATAPIRLMSGALLVVGALVYIPVAGFTAFVAFH